MSRIAASAGSFFKTQTLKGIGCLLPSDKRYWNVYGSIQKRILPKSRELDLIHGKMLAGLELKKTDVLADGGCGAGVWLLKSAPKVSKAYGLDVVPEVLESAQKRIDENLGEGHNVTFLTGDMSKPLPFKDAYFDVFTSILVLSYLGGRQNILNDISRVLKPGGRLALVTPAKGAFFMKVVFAEIIYRWEQGMVWSEIPKLPLALISAGIFGGIAQLKDLAGQWHFYTQDELASELKEAGLEPLSFERVYGVDPRFSSLRGEAYLVFAQKPHNP